MHFLRRLSLVLTLPFLASLAPAGGDHLYTVSSFDDVLRAIDPATGRTLSSTTLTVSGRTIQQCNGLARHPITGDLWVILKIVNASGRSLGKIDIGTGAVAVVGNTGTKISGITFDDRGVLFAISGDGAAPAETLYTLSLVNAGATLFLTLGAGVDGETIGFHPITKKIYHASGFGTRGTDQILEYIDPITKAVTPVSISGDVYEEGLALTHFTGRNFLLADLCDNLFVLSESGAASYIATLDHTPKGMVFAPGTTGSWSRVYGSGCEGSSNHIPVLFGSENPAPNSAAAITVMNGLGGATGFLALGLSNISVPLSPGCDIHILPLSGILIPIQLTGAGDGHGTVSIPFNIPAGLSADTYWQVAVSDSGNLVLSNPLWMHMR